MLMSNLLNSVNIFREMKQMPTEHTQTSSAIFSHLLHFSPSVLAIGSTTGLPVVVTPSSFSCF